MLDNLWQFCKEHPFWAGTFFFLGFWIGAAFKYNIELM